MDHFDDNFNNSLKINPNSSLPLLRKPTWIRAKIPSGEAVGQLKTILRRHKLHTVCEEAACPNLGECFSEGVATFMIMGKVCTRRCPFCEVAHGRPSPLDPKEPGQLADLIVAMGLNYVVITSVNRDDMRDGGAAHFVECVQAIRSRSQNIQIELLIPDFRGRLEGALVSFQSAVPEVLNHNLETVPRLYAKVRPGANYQHSLTVLQRFKEHYPQVITKSGLMVGLGETLSEVGQVMQDLRAHHCQMLTIGQYLQPSRDHLPVERYVTPEEFEELAKWGRELGFTRVASGPLVRSSYHAEQQIHGHF